MLSARKLAPKIALIVLIGVFRTHLGVLADWSSHGGDLSNSRSAPDSLLRVFPNFTQPSFALPTNASVSTAPGLFGNLVIFPTWDGMLLAYQDTGVLKWKKSIPADYYGDPKSNFYSRTTPTRIDKNYAVIGIAGPADVIAFKLDTGTLLWRKNLDRHKTAQITQSGQFWKGKYMVGTSSTELKDGVPEAERSFVGGFYALDVSTKNVAWEWKMAPPDQSGKGKWTGGEARGSSPSVDTTTNIVYFSTGGAFSYPESWSTCAQAVKSENDVDAVCNSLLFPNVYYNSVVALDCSTGKFLAGRRFDAKSTWAEACSAEDRSESACSSWIRQDSELAHAPSVTTVSFCSCSDGLPGGADGNETAINYGLCEDDGGYKKTVCDKSANSENVSLVYVGQRSGLMWALLGSTLETVWSRAVVPGGPFGGLGEGLAIDAQSVYYGHANSAQRDWSPVGMAGEPLRCGGWGALDKYNGTQLWETPNPACFDPTGSPGDPLSNGRSTTAWGISPPSVAGNGLFVGSADFIRGPPMGTRLLDVYDDGETLVNVGDALPAFGKGGWMHVLDSATGAPLLSFETGAPVYGGASINSNCMWVGQGAGQKPADSPPGTKVFGFCVPSEGSGQQLPNPAAPMSPQSSPSPSPNPPQPAPSSPDAPKKPKNKPYFYDEK